MSRELVRWLGLAGLAHLEKRLLEEGLEPHMLAELSESDLRELGLSLGDRKRFVAALRDAPPDTEASAVPERRMVSVLFCDLVDYTGLSERLDPEDLHELLAEFHRACASAIETYGGYVVRYMGDGSLSLFGYPRAFEDNAERAVLAALAAHGAIDEVDVGSRSRIGEAVRARITVATGEVVVGSLVGPGSSFDEQAAVGETPNLAARLQAAAAPGATVIAGSTHALVEHRFTCDDLGLHTVKGFSRPVRAWQVTGEVAAASRFERAARGKGQAPLVSRESELARLRDAWQAVTDGNLEAVALEGEPGIGKSRLAQTFFETTAATSGVRVQFQCSPFHQTTALYPVVQALRAAAGVEDGDSRDEVRRKLTELFPPRLEQPDRLFELLGGIEPSGDAERSPERRKRDVLEALCDYASLVAARLPVLLLFEDVQWADPTTLELLTRLERRLVGLPAMLMVTARPEWQGEVRKRFDTIVLGRLDGDAVARLVADLEPDALDADLVRSIAARSDGVPLFAEELTRAVLDGAQVQGAGHGSAADVPATLHDSLMARLDRLGGAREVAQYASAIGREFGFDLLRRVWPRDEAALARGLESLQQAGLVRGPTPRPGSIHVFRHALLGEVAYQSLLKRHRRDLHGRIASTLHAHPPAGRPDMALVARHLGWAGMHEPAADAWLQAGRQSLARSNYAEAAADATSGLEAVGHAPATPERDALELELELRRGQALLAARGWSVRATGEAYERALKLSLHLGNARMFPVMYGLYTYRLVRGEYRLSLGVASEAVNQARALANPGYGRLGYRWRGLALLLIGELDQARDDLAQALEARDPAEHRPAVMNYGTNARSSTLVFMALCDALSGRRQAAMAACEEAVDYADELGAPFDRCHQLSWSCTVYATLDEAEHLDRVSRRLRTLSDEHGLTLWQTSAGIYRALARLHQGDRDARDDFKRAARAYRDRLGARHLLATALVNYAARLLAMDLDPSDAREALEEAARLMEATGEKCYAGERARLAARLGEASAAVATLRGAIAESTEQGAGLWVARGTLDLAEALRARGERSWADELLDALATRASDPLEGAEAERLATLRAGNGGA